jgi:hypothetical protein
MAKYNRIPDPSDPRNDLISIKVLKKIRETDKAYLCEVNLKNGGTAEKWFPKKQVKYEGGNLLTTKGFLNFINNSNSLTLKSKI